MTGGRLFQTRGPVTANALSPSDVVVRGMSSIMLAADREPGRPRPARRKSSARYPGAQAVQALVNQCRQLDSDANEVTGEPA